MSPRLREKVDVRRELPRVREAFERYSDLVREQLDAVDRGDIERVSALAERRDELASTIDAALDGLTTDALDEASRRRDSELERMLAGVRLAIEQAQQADRTLQRRLRAARDAALRSVHGMDEREESIRRYVDVGPRAGRLDIRL